MRDPLEQIHSATAMVALSRITLIALLMRRDAVLEHRDPTGEGWALETASLAPISFKRLFAANGEFRPVLVARHFRSLSAQS